MKTKEAFESIDSRESFAHKAAKFLLAKWLRNERESIMLSYNGVQKPFHWQSNRYGPRASLGIWLEYPFDCGKEFEPWDESQWDGNKDWNSAIPTLEQYREMKNGKFPDMIFDIAIQHKGTIIAAFEVVWKNGISDDKRYLIEQSDLDVFIISAHWILSQIKEPDCLKLDDFIPCRSSSFLAWLILQK